MALVAVGVVDFLVYRSSDLCGKARDTGDLGIQIQMLQKAKGIFPWSDQICYELGKAHFELGMQGLNEGLDAVSHVKQSVKNLERAVKMNPASPFSHFAYAQSLQYESLLTGSSSDRIYAEYQIAGKLAGEDRELLFDVGKKLLARWKYLEKEERDFVGETLRTALQWKPLDKFPALLNLWHLNVGDVSVMESILPEDPRIYRMFGNYLGEKSVDLGNRHRILSKADYLEFEIQKNLLDAAQRESVRSNWSEAGKFFGWCLGNLPKIRFFHKISGYYPLSDSGFQHVYAYANLGLARSILESGGRIEDVRENLLEYLENENDGNSLKKFETDLTRYRLSDPDILFFLYHKLGRYQDIVDAAGKVQSLDLSAKTLYLIGSAHYKIGNPRDAAFYFDRSLETDATNLKTLLPIREFYRNMNNRGEVFKIDGIIEAAVVSKEKNLSDLVIDKHKHYSWQLPLAGGEIEVDLYFQRKFGDRAPLITVEFNQEVVWDDFLEGKSLSVSVNAVTGKNILRISAVDYPVVLEKMAYRSR